MTDATATTPSDVLRFWFGEPGGELSKASRRWFVKDAAFDEEIRARFGALMAAAAEGSLDAWTKGEGAAQGSLALVVLLDQMSRNAHRDDAKAFAQDARALSICLAGLDSGLANQLSFVERYMFQMPLMHAEDRAVAKQSVDAFTALAAEAERAGAPAEVTKMLVSAVDYAEKHAVIVERFGRYPHRNAILGRASTDEEVAFLTQPGSSF